MSRHRILILRKQGVSENLVGKIRKRVQKGGEERIFPVVFNTLCILESSGELLKNNIPFLDSDSRKIKSESLEVGSDIIIFKVLQVIQICRQKKKPLK